MSKVIMNVTLGTLKENGTYLFGRGDCSISFIRISQLHWENSAGKFTGFLCANQNSSEEVVGYTYTIGTPSNAIPEENQGQQFDEEVTLAGH